MDATPPKSGELVRLVRQLRRARRAFIDAAISLGSGGLETVLDDSDWTVRRLVEYCRARERFVFSRMYHFFDEESKVYDSPAASLDHIAPEDPHKDFPSECSDVWLAGRETELWLDVIEAEDLDESRPASPDWPHPGWTIRGVFQTTMALYREKAGTLKSL